MLNLNRSTKNATPANGVSPIREGKQWLRLGDVKRTAPYQRERDPAIRKMLETQYDEDKVTPVLVLIYPDETLEVGNGHHRTDYWWDTYGEEYRFEAVVKRVKTVEEAAELALRWQNLDKRFNSCAVWHHEEFIPGSDTRTVEDIIGRSGFKVSLCGNNPPVGTFVSLSACKSVYRAHGDRHLASVLGFIRVTWPLDKQCTAAKVIKGISWFLKDYPDGKWWDQQRVIDVLRDIELRSVITAVSAMPRVPGTKPESLFAAHLAGLHNKNRTHGRNLYSSGFKGK